MTEFHTEPLEALRLGPGARRPRRLRRTPALRDLVRETTLGADDFVYPLFVVPGEGVRNPIPSMPGIDQVSADLLAGEARELAELGIQAVLLFGIPSSKDPLGLESFVEDGVVQNAVRALKDASPELVVMTDVCLCEYTDHGHCGVLRGDGSVDNDATLPLLARAAVSLADYDVLLRLARAPDRTLRMTALAKRVMMSPSGLTRVVDRLVVVAADAE